MQYNTIVNEDSLFISCILRRITVPKRSALCDFSNKPDTTCIARGWMSVDSCQDLAIRMSKLMTARNLGEITLEHASASTCRRLSLRHKCCASVQHGGFGSLRYVLHACRSHVVSLLLVYIIRHGVWLRYTNLQHTRRC